MNLLLMMESSSSHEQLHWNYLYEELHTNVNQVFKNSVLSTCGIPWCRRSLHQIQWQGFLKGSIILWPLITWMVMYAKIKQSHASGCKIIMIRVLGGIFPMYNIAQPTLCTVSFSLKCWICLGLTSDTLLDRFVVWNGMVNSLFIWIHVNQPIVILPLYAVFAFFVLSKGSKMRVTN